VESREYGVVRTILGHENHLLGFGCDEKNAAKSQRVTTEALLAIERRMRE